MDSRDVVELDASEAGTIEQVIEIWRAMLPNIDADAFSVQLKLYQINLLASRVYNRIAGDFSLSDIDVSVLMVIRRERPDRLVRPSDLWRRLHIGPSAMTYRVDRLHELGLVERLPDENDRRSLFLKLTPEGLKVVSEVVRRFNEVTSERLAAMVDKGGNIAELDRQLEYFLKAWATIDE